MIRDDKAMTAAVRQAKAMVKGFGEQGRSTSDAIALAMTPAIYASLQVDRLRAHVEALEQRLAAIESKAIGHGVSRGLDLHTK